MRLEELIGTRIAVNRDGRMTQAEFGERVGRYLGKTWSRQTVSAAEKGGRAFTALELIVIAIVLDIPLSALFLPSSKAGDFEFETPGGVPLPASVVLSYAIPETAEREEIVRQYAEANQQYAEMKRELAQAKQRVTIDERTIENLTDEVLRRVRQQLEEPAPGDEKKH